MNPSSGFCAFAIHRHTRYIAILKSDHVQKIKDTDEYTLTPIQPDNRSVLPGVTPEFINKKQVKENKRPEGWIAEDLLNWWHWLKIKKAELLTQLFSFLIRTDLN